MSLRLELLGMALYRHDSSQISISLQANLNGIGNVVHCFRSRLPSGNVRGYYEANRDT